jgi:aryl-alcohol dehydrogenase
MKSRAAILPAQKAPLIIDEIELPDPRPDQVLVKLFSSGVCYSQLTQMRHYPFERPKLLGHEGTGVVVKAGSEVEHLKEGDHAIVTWVFRERFSGRRAEKPTGATYHGQPLWEDRRGVHLE